MFVLECCHLRSSTPHPKTDFGGNSKVLPFEQYLGPCIRQTIYEHETESPAALGEGADYSADVSLGVT